MKLKRIPEQGMVEKIMIASSNLKTKAKMMAVHVYAAMTLKDLEWVKQKQKDLLLEAHFTNNPPEIATNRCLAIVRRICSIEKIMGMDRGSSIFSRNYKLLASGYETESIEITVKLLPLFSSLPVTNGAVLDLFLELTGVSMDCFNNHTAYDYNDFLQWREVSVEKMTDFPFYRKIHV